MTRAGSAKVLGISDTKGHLGVGADADIAIYDIMPGPDRSLCRACEGKERLFICSIYDKRRRGRGEGRQITATPMGRTYWVDASVPQEHTEGDDEGHKEQIQELLLDRSCELHGAGCIPYASESDKSRSLYLWR